MTINKKIFIFYEIYIKYLFILFPFFLIIGPAFINFFTLSLCIYAFVNYKDFKMLLKSKNKIYLFILISFIFVFPYNSINLENSLIKFLGFIRFPILFFGTIIFLNKNYKYSLIFRKYWIIILLVICIDVIKEYTTGTNFFGFYSNYTGRIASFTNHELIIGYVFIIIFLYCFPILKEIINKKYIYFLLFFLIIISFIIGERSNFIKFFIFSILNFFIFYSFKNYLKNIITLLILFIAIFIFFNQTPQYQKIVSNINLSKKFKDQIYQNRHMPHYFTATKIVMNYPVFGVGLNNFFIESSKKIYSDERFRFNDQRSSTHPHNTHFEIAVDTGLVGYIYFLILFIFITKEYFKKNYKRYKIYSTNHFFLFLYFIIPILPTGSFFGTVTGTVFWLNLSFLIYFYENEK